MTLQQIMEQLLRSRLYRTGVVIRTENGEAHDVLVRDVLYEGSRAFAIVAARARPRQEFRIPLARITGVTGREAPPPGEDAVA